MKLTEAQRAGLEYLGGSTLSSRHISTPRANTLAKLEELGLAEWVPTNSRYEITKAGREAL